MRLSRFLAPNPATRIPSGAARPPTWALPGMPTALAQLLEAATAMLPATLPLMRERLVLLGPS